jgi:hypothetical protein
MSANQTERAYCMKCKTVRLIARALTIILPSGKPAIKGICRGGD